MLVTSQSMCTSGRSANRYTASFGHIIQFMALWNDFLWPLVISSSTDMRTLPSALTLFSSTSGVDHAALMAGAAISLAPLAIAFLLAQRFFTEGIAATGIK